MRSLHGHADCASVLCSGVSNHIVVRNAAQGLTQLSRSSPEPLKWQMMLIQLGRKCSDQSSAHSTRKHDTSWTLWLSVQPLERDALCSVRYGRLRKKWLANQYISVDVKVSKRLSLRDARSSQALTIFVLFEFVPLLSSFNTSTI